MPPASATGGLVWIALDGQTGRLDIANTYKRAGFEIIERCEARDRAAVARITAPWWKRPLVRKPAG